MRMKLKWDTVLTTTVVVCALVTTVLVLRRELITRSTGSAQPAARSPVFIHNWRSQLPDGVLLGSSTATVQLIEFADFECPFCADLHKKLQGLRERYPAQVALTYVHFPLPGHRFALPAARVAECADAQGRFEAMYDQLFEGQESFGRKPWADFAAAAGVPDLAAFDQCVKRDDPVPRIEKGQQLGAELDVTGTPTLMVNGWLLGRPPTTAELEAMVKAVLAGKSPVQGAHKS